MPDKLGDKVRLQHILDAIEAIERYTKDATQQEFVDNSMMFDATLRQLEIIGEASNHLSEALLQETSDIPWARVIGLRNLVIHEYFGVDDLTIWSIIKVNIPQLKEKVSLIVSAS